MKIIKILYRNRLLVIILLLAAVLRFTWLGRFPVSLSCDEVTTGYDAFLILKTGHDSHQQFMPLIFQALGNYNPGLYAYLTVISEAIFGVNESALRYPAALAGVVIVFLIYQLVLLTTGKKQLSLLTAFVLACSPWHVIYSRGAYEANVAYCLLLAGFYLLIRSFTHHKNHYWGAILILLSVYAYHSEKIIAPLLLSGLMIIFRRHLNANYLFRLIIISVIVVLPFVFTLNAQNQTRAKDKFFRNDPEINISLSRTVRYPNINTTILSLQTVVKRYIQVVDLGFIANKSLNLTHSPNLDLGWFYWLELPFLILGMLILLKGKPLVFLRSEYRLAFFLWLLLSPLPASMTMDDYHPFRLLTLTYPLALTIGIGIYFTIIKLGRLGLAKLTMLGLMAIYSINLVYLADYYLVIYPVEKSDWSFDPSRDIARYVLANQQHYDQIIIDQYFGRIGPNTYGVPLNYILFYGQIIPDHDFDLSDKQFGKFTIREIDHLKDSHLENTLLIASPWRFTDLPQEKIINTFYFYDQTPAYYAVPTD